MSRQRILITGATGFIGRHVVAHLVSRNRDLILPIRDIRLCPSFWLQQPQIRIVEVPTLTDESQLCEISKEAETLIHLAGLAHVAATDRGGADDLFMQANALVTQALAKAALETGIKTFIHLSSLASITTNSADIVIKDCTNEEPTTAYGRSKREAERYVRQLADSGIFAVSLRPPSVVGAEARGNWASLQALAATCVPLPFGSIKNQRSFVGMHTLVEAISLLSDTHWPISASGDYCIADPESISLPTLVQLLRSGMGKPAKLFACPPALLDLLGSITGRRRQIRGLTGSLMVDASRFYETFSFRPSQELHDAIRQSGREYLIWRGKSASRGKPFR